MNLNLKNKFLMLKKFILLNYNLKEIFCYVAANLLKKLMVIQFLSMQNGFMLINP